MQVRVPEAALGPCVQSHIEASWKFDLGFDRQATRNETKTVSGVEPGGKAFEAGLRDGQKLVGWSFNFGDSSMQIRLTIDGE
jgi:predicted metalloprotease with PDZ domain